MSRARYIKDTVRDLEFELAKQKAVQTEFPQARVHALAGFQSKIVNRNYTKFEFLAKRDGLYVLPYYEVKFTFEDKTEIVKVYSMPKANRLAYIQWNINLRDYIMRFSRVAINMKNNEFREDMLNSCRAEIMGFIKQHPRVKLNDKHLEPRLKKLLVFT